ncbi:hypothetical protein Cantr_09982 [Candida viswanathii]|uniref:Glycine-rich domain-containing protein 1 n=1 Tax=Candida viswanathii TaxID=5486 RepID=A0A367YD21_9ASCO|nr:hypothetical protein Cantr_09982 [Candida viswanathii]
MSVLPRYQDEAPPVYVENAPNNSHVKDYRSYQYSTLAADQGVQFNLTRPTEFMPNTTEATTHLKLLKAFGELKKKVIGGEPISEEERGKRWKGFVTLAVRRFVIFISALRLRASNFVKEERTLESSTDSRSQPFNTIVNQLTPPLDVIMVWHSFILNPTTFYDVFVRNDMYYFVNYPFPLHIIDPLVDNTTYEFRVTDESKKHYLSFIGEFIRNANDLQYDPNLVSFMEQKVTLYNPHTGYAISGEIPLTTLDGMGFVDEGLFAKNLGFRYKHLSHDGGGPEFLTHDELHKILLDYDVDPLRILEGTIKFYSRIMGKPMYINRKPEQMSNEISRDVITVSKAAHESMSRRINPTAPQLHEILRGVSSKSGRRRAAEKLILGGYLRFNAISLTVPNAVLIGEDLVDCVVRQGSFVDKMNNLNWLNSPLKDEGLAESLIRYERFFELLTDKTLNRMLVPTLDIDLFWHTHQLMLYGYIRDCKYSPGQRLIDHNDKIGEKPLDDGFSYTSKLYKVKFKEDYSICFCAYCVAKRASKTSKLAKVFKSLKKVKDELIAMQASPLFLKDGESMTHVSDHCSVAQFAFCYGGPGGCASVARCSQLGGVFLGGTFIGAAYVGGCGAGGNCGGGAGCGGTACIGAGACGGSGGVCGGGSMAGMGGCGGGGGGGGF